MAARLVRQVARAVRPAVTRAATSGGAARTFTSSARVATAASPASSVARVMRMTNTHYGGSGSGSGARSRVVVAAAAAAALAAGMALTQQSGRADAKDGKDIPIGGIPGTYYERSFIAVKPDGVNRALVGEIIQRFEKRGYVLVGLKLVKPTEQMAAGHYDDLKAKPFFPGLIKFFSSGPIVAMVWQGKDVIKTGRAMLGATNPLASTPGTIRGDFAIDVGRNVCHGSDSPAGAAHEIAFWFSAGELVAWEPTNARWTQEK
jgi:nucleoside-diphosphate kinase